MSERPDLLKARAAWRELEKALDSGAFAAPEENNWKDRAADAMNDIAQALRFPKPELLGVGVPAIGEGQVHSSAASGLAADLTTLSNTLPESGGAVVAGARDALRRVRLDIDDEAIAGMAAIIASGIITRAPGSAASVCEDLIRGDDGDIAKASIAVAWRIAALAVKP